MIMRLLNICVIAAITAVSPAPRASAEVPSAPTTSPVPTFNPANYSGGNGLSKPQAIVLLAPSEAAGVASEYLWVAHTYPGSKVLQQALTTWQHGKRYDVLTVETLDKAKVALWFDITSMYK
jgi:hypothetical protein